MSLSSDLKLWQAVVSHLAGYQTQLEQPRLMRWDLVPYAWAPMVPALASGLKQSNPKGFDCSHPDYDWMTDGTEWLGDPACDFVQLGFGFVGHCNSHGLVYGSFLLAEENP